MKLIDIYNTELSVVQAIQWNRSPEKFIFCTDILDELGLPRTDANVELMENVFEGLLVVHKEISGWDIHNEAHAQTIANTASLLTGETYIATDAGDHCHPRYDVIKAPKVGDLVSYAFNGDYYPCGVITAISKTLKKITTSEGQVFYRRKSTGCWKYRAMWNLVGGHINRWNPEF